MYRSEHERFIRGRTHVETVYLTLLDKVLTSDQPWPVFVDKFIDYIYKSVVIPKILLDKSGQLDFHFKLLVERAFRRKFPKLETYPDFVNADKDPLEVCIEFLLSNADKLFPSDVIRSQDITVICRLMCSEVVYTASMAFLQDLELIR